MTQALLNIAIVLLFSAFFSGIEMAFRASDKLRAELDRHHTGLTSRILSLFYGKPNDFISAMLVGNFISLVVYSLLMAGVVSQMLSGVSLPVCRNDAVQLTLQVAVTAFIVIITGELLPKTLFKINPHRMLRIFAIPAFLLYAVLCPIAQCINAVARGMLRLVGIRVNRQASEQAFTKIDLDNLIQSSLESTEDEHELNEEIKIFQNALYFSEIKVRDCMVPRTEIEAIESTSSIETLKNRFIESGNSKIIVYKEDIDHIVGFIHSSEMFRNPADWTAHIKEVPRYRNHFLLQTGIEKLICIRKLAGQVFNTGPNIECSQGLVGRCMNTQLRQTLDHHLALNSKFLARSEQFRFCVPRRELFNDSALNHGGRTAVDGTGCTVNHFNEIFRADCPTGAPARVTESLCQTVKNNHRIPVNILHIRQGRNCTFSRCSVFVIRKGCIEFVSTQQAIFFSCRINIAIHCFALNHLSGRIAGIGKDKSVRAHIVHKVFKTIHRNRKAILFFSTQFNQFTIVTKRIKIVFVGCVIGIFVGNTGTVFKDAV